MHDFLSPAVYLPAFARFAQAGLLLIFWVHVLTNTLFPQCLAEQVPDILSVSKWLAVAEIEDCPLEGQPVTNFLAVDVVRMQDGNAAPGAGCVQV